MAGKQVDVDAVCEVLWGGPQVRFKLIRVGLTDKFEAYISREDAIRTVRSLATKKGGKR